MIRYFKILTLLLLPFIHGCVGTIDKAEPTATESVQYNKGNMTFGGVYEANAISDTAVEIFFFPATGGSGEYTYAITLGDSPTPVNVTYNNLQIDYRGLIKKTIRNLSRGTEYLISISVFDQVDRTTNVGEKEIKVKTFSHLVAKFEGIKEVENLQGTEGVDSFKIKWNHAYKDYSQFFSLPSDPDFYEIILIDAGKRSPVDVDNKFLTTAQGRYVFYKPFDDDELPETTVRGLPADTLFYVFVRAIHLSSINDPSDKTLRSELNTDYILKRTLNDDLPEFDQTSILLSSFRTTTGENATSIGWDPIIGLFDHIRIYYKIGSGQFSGTEAHLISACNNQIDNNGVICKKLGYTALGTEIANLERETAYSYQMVVCSTPECGPGKRIASSNFNLTTLNGLADFAGLTSVRGAKTLSEVGNVFINYSLPNLETGNIDGIGIKLFIKAQPTDQVPTDFNDNDWIDLDNQSIYTTKEFDFKTAGVLELEGFDYSDKTREYCFELYARYTVNAVETKVDTGIVSCLKLTINTPTKNQFPGLSDASMSGSSKNISMLWNLPSSGIYSDFMVIIRTTSGAFNYAEAIDAIEAGDYSDYTPYTVSPNITSFVINQLSEGETYKVGILTKFIDDDGGDLSYVYSANNTRIYTCTMPANGNAACSLGSN